MHAFPLKAQNRPLAAVAAVYLNVFCCVTTAFAAEHSKAPNSQPRPNIVVLLCDDLGYGDLECFGHPHIKTPNLNRMAQQGLRLTACYSAAPVCSPSRVGLLTGRSPNRAGVYDWIPANSRPQPNAREQVHMQKKEVTIPRLLKDAGYATCLAGKWHCNSQFNAKSQPQPNDFGFDHWFSTQNNASPSHENPNNFVRNGAAVGRLEGFSCQLAAFEAIRWLEQQNAKSPQQPFFLFVPFHEPHEPVASPPKLVESYRSVARDADEAQYFANVENMDSAVGQLLAALKRLKKDQNTLVIFSSDNGPETLRRYRGARRSYGRPDPLKGMKLWTTEAGFRVPGIMLWPNRIRPGGVCDQPISSLDFLPTFSQLGQAETPKDLVLDGTVFLPAIDGGQIKRKKPLFWCYFNAINEHRAAMRDGPWKMLAKLNGGKLPRHTNVFDGNVAKVKDAKLSDFELYRIGEDISESKNVIDRHPQQAARLQAQMQSAYADLLDNGTHWTRVNAKPNNR